MNRISMNKHVSSIILFLVFLLAGCFSTFLSIAQSADARLWTGAKIEYRFNKKMELACELEQRFDNNISNFDRLLLEPSLSYKMNKSWSLGASFRSWYRQNAEHSYDFKQRGNLDISYQKNIKSFGLKLSSGIQYGVPDLIQVSSSNSQDLASRNSIRINYNIFGTRFSPSIKYELFTKIDQGSLLNYQWRATVSTSYYINQAISLRFLYAFEQEYNLEAPFSSHIYGLGLNYKL
jgi:long-subunit fatty acid transport protein